MKTFSSWLTEFMESQNLSIPQVAELAGVTAKTVYEWKDQKGPGLPDLVRDGLLFRTMEHRSQSDTLTVSPRVQPGHEWIHDFPPDGLRDLQTILASHDKDALDGILSSLRAYARSVMLTRDRAHEPRERRRKREGRQRDSG